MPNCSASDEIWDRVKNSVAGENESDVLVALIGGVCSIIVDSGDFRNEDDVRAYLAAILLSPYTGSAPGSLVGRLPAEIKRLEERELL